MPSPTPALAGSHLMERRSHSKDNLWAKVGLRFCFESSYSSFVPPSPFLNAEFLGKESQRFESALERRNVGKSALKSSTSFVKFFREVILLRADFPTHFFLRVSKSFPTLKRSFDQEFWSGIDSIWFESRFPILIEMFVTLLSFRLGPSHW